MSSFWSFPQKIRRNRSVSAWSMSGRAKSPKPITTEDIAANQLLGALMGDSKGSNHSLQWTRATVTRPAPCWEGTAIIKGAMREIKLTDFRGKYLVFFFYPLAFTYLSPTEVLAFSDRISEFHSIGAEVVACSVDSPHAAIAWLNVPRSEGGLGGQVNVALLSDPSHKICKDYGVFLEEGGHPISGLFIIDDKGIVRNITLSDVQVGRSVDEVLRLVQAFQFTDKHGEVCPADWTPGGDTIIPDQKEKMKYFKSLAKENGSTEK